MANAAESDTGSVARIKALFEPSSVAVIGASRREEAVGFAILNNLLQGGYTGKIFPVNPKADEILGVRCFPTIQDIPDPIDLAVIIVPSHAVPDALQQCADKGAPAAIIITAGFREIGGVGVELEAEVIRIAEERNMAVLGPNCLGLINTDPGFCMNASFSNSMPQKGNIAFVSQSGALCTAALDYAQGTNIRFSKFISLGNKANVNEVDILRYLATDDKTQVILMYLEDLVDARDFILTGRSITGDQQITKPTLVIKAGRTLQGAKAAQSHTGSLMGADELYDAIFKQAGAIRMDSVEDMFDMAKSFGKQPLPKGNRVAIITNAGGPGIMATDACVRSGLEVAPLGDETVEELKKVLPPTANFHNPVDVIGDARHERYEDALRIVAKDPNIDGIIVILTPQAMTAIEETAQVIVNAEKEIDVPVIACFMGIVDVSAGVKILDESPVPTYRFPEGAAHAMAAMHKARQWVVRPRTVEKQFTDVDKKKVDAIIEKAVSEKKSFLPIHESMEILKAYGFPVIPCGLATSREEAESKAAELGFPLAMKVISQDVIHKFDMGGVKLDINSAYEAAAAYDAIMESILKEMPTAKIDGVFLQAMSQKGCEVILGMNRDPHLGPTIMFGLGGIYVEALKDVTFRLAPIRMRGADLMINSIRARKILDGIRGEAPSDKEAIAECLQRLSQLAYEQPMIQEIDVNPLIAHAQGHGASVVDARVILDVEQES